LLAAGSPGRQQQAASKSDNAMV